MALLWSGLDAGLSASVVVRTRFSAALLSGISPTDLIHHSIHRDDTKSGVLNWLRRYHFQHHFAATDRQFGVSTPIWDYVFRTGR